MKRDEVIDTTKSGHYSIGKKYIKIFRHEDYHSSLFGVSHQMWMDYCDKLHVFDTIEGRKYLKVR